jgi:hypothetical protein
MKKAKREGTGSRAVLELTETSETETRENAWQTATMYGTRPKLARLRRPMPRNSAVT